MLSLRGFFFYACAQVSILAAIVQDEPVDVIASVGYAIVLAVTGAAVHITDALRSRDRFPERI